MFSHIPASVLHQVPTTSSDELHLEGAKLFRMLEKRHGRLGAVHALGGAMTGAGWFDGISDAFNRFKDGVVNVAHKVGDVAGTVGNAIKDQITDPNSFLRNQGLRIAGAAATVVPGAQVLLPALAAANAVNEGAKKLGMGLASTIMHDQGALGLHHVIGGMMSAGGFTRVPGVARYHIRCTRLLGKELMNGGAVPTAETSIADERLYGPFRGGDGGYAARAAATTGAAPGHARSIPGGGSLTGGGWFDGPMAAALQQQHTTPPALYQDPRFQDRPMVTKPKSFLPVRGGTGGILRAHIPPKHMKITKQARQSLLDASYTHAIRPVGRTIYATRPVLTTKPAPPPDLISRYYNKSQLW